MGKKKKIYLNAKNVNNQLGMTTQNSAAKITNDLLSFWNSFTLDIKLSFEFIYLRLQLEILFIFLVKFLNKIPLNFFKVFMMLLIFVNLSVEVRYLALHLILKTRTFSFLTFRLCDNRLHIALIIRLLCKQGTFTISEYLTEFKLFRL